MRKNIILYFYRNLVVWCYQLMVERDQADRFDYWFFLRNWAQLKATSCSICLVWFYNQSSTLANKIQNIVLRKIQRLFSLLFNLKINTYLCPAIYICYWGENFAYGHAFSSKLCFEKRKRESEEGEKKCVKCLARWLLRITEHNCWISNLCVRACQSR